MTDRGAPIARLCVAVIAPIMTEVNAVSANFIAPIMSKHRVSIVAVVTSLNKARSVAAIPIDVVTVIALIIVVVVGAVAAYLSAQALVRTCPSRFNLAFPCTPVPVVFSPSPGMAIIALFSRARDVIVNSRPTGLVAAHVPLATATPSPHMTIITTSSVACSFITG